MRVGWCMLVVRSRVEKEGREVVGIYELGATFALGYLVGMYKIISENYSVRCWPCKLAQHCCSLLC